MVVPVSDEAGEEEEGQIVDEEDGLMSVSVGDDGVGPTLLTPYHRRLR